MSLTRIFYSPGAARYQQMPAFQRAGKVNEVKTDMS